MKSSRNIPIGRGGEGSLVKTAALPYSVMNLSEWSVTVLFAEKELEEYQGLPLEDIVDFNPISVNANHIESDVEYRYLDLSCVSSTTGFITEYQIVVGKELPARAKLKVKEGDILLSTVRPERNLVALVTKEYDECIVNTSFAVLRPRKIASEVLYFILRSSKMNEFLSAKAKGSAIPTLKLKDLKEIKIPVNNVNQEITNKAKAYQNWLKQNQSIKTVQEIVEEKFIEYNFISNTPSNKKKGNSSIFPYDKLEDRLDVSYYLDKPQQNWLISIDYLSNIANDFNPGITVSSKSIRMRVLPIFEYKIYNKPEFLEKI